MAPYSPVLVRRAEARAFREFLQLTLVVILALSFGAAWLVLWLFT